MEELSDKEFKKTMIKFNRDSKKHLGEFNELKNYVVEIKQVKNGILYLEQKVECLTNRVNTAEDRISEMEDNQSENKQLIKQLETNLNKANRSTQERK